MDYNILVTGGAGYLGAVLVKQLLEKGNDVTVLDNFMFAPNSLMDCCNYDSFKVTRGDARDKTLLEELTRDKDIVIPLAALVGAPLCERDRIGARTTNAGAVKTLTEVLSPQQRIIIPITNSGYGVGQEGIYCTEQTPLNPISFYGKTKVDAEEYAMDRENSVSLRLATVFGASPRMRLDLLANDFTYRAVKDRFIVIFEGRFKRNYIHIRDVAKAFIHVIDNFETMKNEPYNVGLSDANISKLELCAQIQKLLPDFVYIEAEVGEDPDKRDYIVSNEKIEKTGFKPDYTIERGVAELIKAYTIIVDSKYSNV
ncbi:MAG: NAD-dependent epimerase/dehydratase [Phycisphaerae bacterium]|nr:NAD-dependent epimerase/dehydratase [Phycisphaerae bacterium]